MSQFGQVKINYNTAQKNAIRNNISKAFIIGLSQRGPVYKPIAVSSLNSFLTIFGQPTTSYEFSFFEAVKSTVNSGGIAICYRIPYYDLNKKLYDTKFEYYITDPSEISPITPKSVLEDYRNPNIKYDVFINEKQESGSLGYNLGLFIRESTEMLNVYNHITLKYINESDASIEYYYIYIDDFKMYAQKVDTLSPSDRPLDYFDMTYYDPHEDKNIEYRLLLKKENDNIKLVLDKVAKDRSAVLSFDSGTRLEELQSTMNVIYRSYLNYNRYNFNNLSGAKLTFTLINDFDSILNVDINAAAPEESTIKSLRGDCYTLKNEIENSQIIGIMPIFFGPKDAENIRNINISELYYNDENVVKNTKFEIYTYKKQNQANPSVGFVTIDKMFETFYEFDKAQHFTSDWFEKEIANLVDKYVPEDTTECKNTLGISFVAFYLNEEHKVDYKILESYYGTVGLSNSKFINLEDLVNNHSCFYHLEIEGSVESDQYIQVYDKKSLIYGDNLCYIPFSAPYSDISINNNKTFHFNNLLNVEDIFSIDPENKFDEKLSISLNKLNIKLKQVDYQNSSPYDYILAPGLIDALTAESIDDDVPIKPSIVSYSPDIVSTSEVELIESTREIYDKDKKVSNLNGLYKILALCTQFGDRGTIAFLDIPKKYQEYIMSYIDSCYNNVDSIKDLLTKQKINDGEISFPIIDLVPQTYGLKEIFNKVYPLFNYQYVDIDKSLTRYFKFKKYKQQFGLVPPSSEIVGAYIAAFNNNDFSAIAGPRSVSYFSNCHASYLNTSIVLYKTLYDLFGITSLINDRDNGTFPIQQTTWKNSTSVLKQIHAFRIYTAIRRAVYSYAKAYLYEPNTETNRNSLQTSLNSMLTWFKDHSYIDSQSDASVWATIQDIEQNQIQVQVVVGIYGAIVKIIVNLNLTDMKIEYVNP